MSRRISFWYKVLALVMVLALIIPVLAACGDDDEKTTTVPVTKTAIPTATPTTATIMPTATATATPTAAPVSTETVKLGALSAWTGDNAVAGLLTDGAVAAVEQQVKDMGGILVGGVRRPLQIIKLDSRTTIAGSVAAVKKGVLDDRVSAILFGGYGAASAAAVSDACEELKVPFFSWAWQVPEDNHYTVLATYPEKAGIDTNVSFVSNYLKPKTVGIVGLDESGGHRQMDGIKAKLQAQGIKLVYEQYYASGTNDFSPYLTKIKRDAPDVLLMWEANVGSVAGVFKQMAGLGGWGDIKVILVSGAVVDPKLGSCVEGIYNWVLWMPGLENPGAQAFESAFKKAGKALNSAHWFSYVPLWTAIKAIELAGDTSPESIIKATRSGKLEWDTPSGHAVMDTNGEYNIGGIIVQVQQGKQVQMHWEE
ncbi:MAG: ABC transporter substrate-binding protein [Dehalococcoidia bacterium]